MSKLKRPLAKLNELRAQACRKGACHFPEVVIELFQWIDWNLTRYTHQCILCKFHRRVIISFEQSRPRSSELLSRALFLRISYSPQCVPVGVELHDVETVTCVLKVLCETHLSLTRPVAVDRADLSTAADLLLCELPRGWLDDDGQSCDKVEGNTRHIAYRCSSSSQRSRSTSYLLQLSLTPPLDQTHWGRISFFTLGCWLSSPLLSGLDIGFPASDFPFGVPQASLHNGSSYPSFFFALGVTHYCCAQRRVSQSFKAMCEFRGRSQLLGRLRHLHKLLRGGSRHWCPPANIGLILSTPLLHWTESRSKSCLSTARYLDRPSLRKLYLAPCKARHN